MTTDATEDALAQRSKKKKKKAHLQKSIAAVAATAKRWQAKDGERKGSKSFLLFSLVERTNLCYLQNWQRVEDGEMKALALLLLSFTGGAY